MSDFDPFDEPGLVDRYLANEASPEERASVEGWVNAEPTRRELIERMCFVAGNQASQIPVRDIDAALTATLSRSLMRSTQTTVQPKHSNVRVWLPVSIMAAALMVFAFANRGSVTAHAVPTAYMYATRSGERATVKLSDGSQVTLAPGTKLTVAAGFGASSRDVTVDGEAYFSVVHTQGAPFSVHTGHALARVLGTSFVVRKYANDAVARIVVTNGRVAVHGKSGTSRILTAADMAVVSDSGAVTTISGIATDDYTAWLNGRVVFRGTPFRDVATELSRAYGVDIVVADSALTMRRVTLTAATESRSLTAVLDALAPIIDAHYTRNGGVVTFHNGTQMHAQPRSTFSQGREREYGK